MAVTHLPIRRSALFGVTMYLVGYLLTLVATFGQTAKILSVEVAGRNAAPARIGEILAGTPSNEVMAAWLFYNAHFVPTSLPTADAINGFTVLTNQNLINEIGGVTLLLYLVPPLLLVSAGYLIAKTGQTTGANGPRNAGASIAIGYVPLFVAGSFVFTASATSAPVSASPDGLQTIFLGLVYPIVFGGIGGMVAGKHAPEPEELQSSDRQPRWS